MGKGLWRETSRIGAGLLALVVLVSDGRTAAPAASDESPREQELLDAYRKGEAFIKQGKYREAVPFYGRALELAPAVHGAKSRQAANLMNKLANCYWNLGQYAKAEPLYQRNLEIREARLNEEPSEVAQSLNNLAGLYESMGHYDKAEPLYLRSLTIREERLGKDHADVAESLNNLAGLYRAMGWYVESERLYKHSLQIREARLGKDHADVAQTLNNLAVLYGSMGRYAEAEQLHQRSLKIREARLAQDHADVAQSLNNLAVLYEAMGQYDKAEPLGQRGLRILEARLGKDHPRVATSLNNLAGLYASMRQYDKAEPLYQRSLRIMEAWLGKDHPHLATCHNNLAVLYKSMGQYDKAVPLYQRSLRIRKDRLGEDHPLVAVSLNNLAQLFETMNHPAEAEPLYRSSLRISEARLGAHHPQVATSLNNLATLYAAMERWDEATDALERACRGRHHHVQHVLPALSEREQLTFLHANHEPGLRSALSLALLRAKSTRGLSDHADWLSNGKALAQQSLAEQILLTRDAAGANADTVRQLFDVRRRLAALTLAAPASGQETPRRQQIQDMSRQEQELAKRLAHAHGRKLSGKPWIELKELRKAIPADGVFLDIARFGVFDFQARGDERKWRPAHYAAFVIPAAGKGHVRLIDLGEAEAIDRAVQSLRQALQQAPQTIRVQGEPDSEKEVLEPLRALSRLVLGPLLPHIGQSQRWLVSPDGALWLVPWAALPLEDGSYVIEKHSLRYLVNGRDLVANTEANKDRDGAAHLFADPDFDLAPAEAATRAAEPVLRGLSLPAVARLPGTAREAALVAPKLRQLTGKEPAVHTGAGASERQVKAIRRPRLLMLSTHGFFLPDPEKMLDKSGKKLENPLLRCGLLLAGCNQRQKAAEGEEDGVLTGLEIVGLDLRGTELVVLSACETGLGDVRNGEGVAGLRQAFQLAGAQSVLATLWQIPDRETAQLMSDFCDNLARGKDRADALCEAQRGLIQARRSRHGAAHPFFWAAFTLTGQ